MKDLKNYFINKDKKNWWSLIFSFKGLSFTKGLLKLLALIFCFGILVVIITLTFLLVWIGKLPDVSTLKDYQYDLSSVVYDINDEPIYEYFDKLTIVMKDDEIPDIVKNALVSAEDTRFYNHFGIDIIRIIKALFVDIMSLSIVQGASTITQQTAKIYFLSPEKTLKRKLTEILIAIKLEKNFTKDHILSLYLNKAFFGFRSYGIAAAAKSYFNKTPAELSIGETATLIGLLPAPSRYSPIIDMQAALERRNLVLRSMHKQGYVEDDILDKILASDIKLNLSNQTLDESSAFFSEEARRYLADKYSKELVNTGGFNVLTTMHPEIQKSAHAALQDGLFELEKRHGYRGPFYRSGEDSNINTEELEKNLANNDYSQGSKVIGKIVYVSKENALAKIGDNIYALITLSDSKWALPYNPEEVFDPEKPLDDLSRPLKLDDYVEIKIMDQLIPQNYTKLGIKSDLLKQDIALFKSIIYPTPYHNGGVLVMNLETGQILAMSGGYSFSKSHFNRATQSYRQLGSALKPFLYAAALENGYTSASILEDSPIIFENVEAEQLWIPRNYSYQFSGYLRLREALVFSKNIPTINLANDIGLSKLFETLTKLKIDTSKTPRDLSAVLGSGSYNLWEIIRAYSVFANKGNMVEPYFIRYIYDKDNKILENNYAQVQPTVIDPRAAFIISDILYDVSRRGTGSRSKVLNFPSAGKTGTTNGNNNAWFIGYAGKIIAGVYVGNDDFRVSMGKLETGARAALPIWINVMREAAKYFDVTTEFVLPNGIVQVDINPNNGKIICQDSALTQTTVKELFLISQIPLDCQKKIKNPNLTVLNDKLVKNTYDPSLSAINTSQNITVSDEDAPATEPNLNKPEKETISIEEQL